MAEEPAIPRDALERVLARATELQGVSGEPNEAISESRLMEVAREVGIDGQHLRQALAEERARIAFDAPGGGPILDALGPALVDAQRVVPGSATEIQARLDAWLPRMEGLAVRRKMPQRTSWEPRHDPIGNALRALGGEPGALRWIDSGDALDLPVAGLEAPTARFALEAALKGIDVIVQSGEGPRRKALLIADMDSTMIACECIDEL